MVNEERKGKMGSQAQHGDKSLGGGRGFEGCSSMRI
jgi:hypothetical protein